MKTRKTFQPPHHVGDDQALAAIAVLVLIGAFMIAAVYFIL